MNGRTRKRSAAGGWSEAEVCAEKLPLRGGPCMEDNAAASGSSCELANPAQVRQIASQTGVLLCRMRFVAGRGAVAKLLQAGDRRHRGLPAGTLQRRAIGKTLPAGALQRRAIGKQARKEPPLQAGKEHPVLQANKKESGKNHSLLSPLL